MIAELKTADHEQTKKRKQSINLSGQNQKQFTQNKSNRPAGGYRRKDGHNETYTRTVDVLRRT